MDYVADVAKYTSDVNEAAVAGIVKHCGIALRSKDAATVSSSSPEELETVREKFLKKKLELAQDDTVLDAAIDAVCEAMGKSNRNKGRVAVYYLLAEKFDKLAMFE